MLNKKINSQNHDSQRPAMGLNLVGPTKSYLDSDVLKINSELAAKFEELNAGAIE